MRALQALMLVLALAFPLAPAQAAYPEKPVTIIVPFAAGGAVDLLTRLMSKYAEPELGAPLVVENKPGAGGQIGWSIAAKARPDGYTLVALSMPSMVLVKELRQNVPFNLNDFISLCNIQTDPIVWVVNAESEFKTATDLVEWARKNPGMLNVGVDGPQSNNQLQHLVASKLLNFTTNDVCFDGSGAALVALLGKKVDLVPSSLSAAYKYMPSGKVRALALFDDVSQAGVPTAKDIFKMDIPNAGLSMRGIAVPKNTPPDVVAKLVKAFKGIVENPEFVEQTKKLGLTISYLPGDALDKIVVRSTELVREYRDLLK